MGVLGSIHLSLAHQINKIEQEAEEKGYKKY